MQQLVSLWSSLAPRSRVTVIGATLVVFFAVLALGRMAAQPSMALLYAGLDGPVAGEVVEALEQRGVRYEVRGDSILIPAKERDRVRMTLASQGLPANGSAGYELLDGLSGFGTTSQMFDAAYWRAKEGELARTISASPQVRSARVHIGQSASQPFRREIAPTASVTVTPSAGSVQPGLARAVQHLVASAVPALQATDVAVIDGTNGIVLSGEEAETATASSGDREKHLRRAVERLLEAHVGRGRALVEVSVETVTERETILERRLDPDSRVALSIDTEERNSSASGSRGGGVTVASNLPDGDAVADGGQSRSQNTETRERSTFDTSEVHRELHRHPGATRKLTVAAVVDGVYAPDDTGAMQWSPRPEAELDAMRELIASAVGFDAERGDVVTLKSLQLAQVDEFSAGEGSDARQWQQLDLMQLLQLAVLAVVSLALILFVIRPMLARAPQEVSLPTGGSLPSPPGGIAPAPLPTLPDIAPVGAPPPLAQAAMPAIGDFDRFKPTPGRGEASGDDAVARLRRLIEERQDETIEILRSWMEDDEEENA